jgi:hypothetical protein
VSITFSLLGFGDFGAEAVEKGVLRGSSSRSSGGAG